MVKASGRKKVVAVNVTEDDLEPYSEKYQAALEAVAVQVKDE